VPWASARLLVGVRRSETWLGVAEKPAPQLIAWVWRQSSLVVQVQVQVERKGRKNSHVYG